MWSNNIVMKDYKTKKEFNIFWSYIWFGKSKMKTTLLSASDSQGGAAIAAERLLTALSKSIPESDLKVDLVVRHQTNAENKLISNVKQFQRFTGEKIHPRFILEKLFFDSRSVLKKFRFSFSTAKLGFPLQKNPKVKASDILHFHWINNSFISLNGMKTLFASGKPIVWTLHDMWAFTGGCHYSGECRNYKKSCGDCPYLKNPAKHDLSFEIHQKKQSIYGTANLNIVTCSHWLAEKARTSSLLKNFPISVIPNPIDTNLFSPKVKKTSREHFKFPQEKFLLLFGAANVNDERKGLKFLLESMKILFLTTPEIAEKIELVIVGKNKAEGFSIENFKTHDTGMITSKTEMAELYSAADIFILPSLEDNLPNTIMESMSCGTPVVGFDSGGIPEMIQHQKTGYLATYKSAEDLADGIKWMMDSENRKNASEASRKFVLENYSEKIVAEKYFRLYESILSKK